MFVQVRAVVRRAERRDLVRHHRPAAVLGQVVVHRLRDRVAVRVVRRHVRGLAVLAERLHEDRTDRVRRGLAVEVLAEAVADAVLAGGVVGPGDAGDVQHLFALRELVERHRDRARRRARQQDRLVLGDEALLRLHRVVRLRGGVGDAVLHLLAEHALLGLRRDRLDQRMAVVDVLDRELVALELVLALHRIGAGARHRDADEDAVALRAGRPGADRRLVRRERPRGEPCGQREPAGDAQARFQECATVDTVTAVILVFHCDPPPDRTMLTNRRRVPARMTLFRLAVKATRPRGHGRPTQRRMIRGLVNLGVAGRRSAPCRMPRPSSRCTAMVF